MIEDLLVLFNHINHILQVFRFIGTVVNRINCFHCLYASGIAVQNMFSTFKSDFPGLQTHFMQLEDVDFRMPGIAFPRRIPLAYIKDYCLGGCVGKNQRGRIESTAKKVIGAIDFFGVAPQLDKNTPYGYWQNNVRVPHTISKATSALDKPLSF